jgi:hypothetical protein
MKKLLISILAFLYIASSCEATVYVHYCMGRKVGFSFFPDNATGCHRCGMKKSARGTACCKDEIKVLKSDKNQKLTEPSFSTGQQKKIATIPIAYFTHFTSTLPCISTVHEPSHGPPGAAPVPVYLMNCLFLI